MTVSRGARNGTGKPHRPQNTTSDRRSARDALASTDCAELPSAAGVWNSCELHDLRARLQRDPHEALALPHRQDLGRAPPARFEHLCDAARDNAHAAALQQQPLEGISVARLAPGQPQVDVVDGREEGGGGHQQVEAVAQEELVQQGLQGGADAEHAMRT